MAAAKAMSNVLIVQAILQHVQDDADVVQFRLVSPLWNEIILSLVTPRVHVHLNRVVSLPDGVALSPFINPTKLASFPPKLLKSVIFTAHPNDETNLAQAQNLLVQFRAQIQHLSVLGGDNVGPFLHHIFANCRLDQVKNLHVVMDHEKVHRYRRHRNPTLTISQCETEISEKLDLRQIRYVVKSKCFRNLEHSQEQQKILRFLLTMSPNLEYLQVKDDSLSSILGNFNNLKTFKFHWDIGKITRPEITSLQNLNKFLERVKFSLERLKLTGDFTGSVVQYDIIGSRIWHDFLPFRDQFHLPREGIPNLKWFQNGVMRTFKCGRTDFEKMGKLEHLELYEVPKELSAMTNICVGTILRWDIACWGGITTLKLGGIEDIKLLECIGLRFPSVRRLDVNIRVWSENVFLRTIFEKLAPIKTLTHISVGAPFPTRFSKFVDFLEYLTTSFQNVTEIRVDRCTFDGFSLRYERCYQPPEVDVRQMNRLRSLIPALLKSRELTEFTGMQITHVPTGLSFRRGAPFQCEEQNVG